MPKATAPITRINEIALKLVEALGIEEGIEARLHINADGLTSFGFSPERTYSNDFGDEVEVEVEVEEVDDDEADADDEDEDEAEADEEEEEWDEDSLKALAIAKLRTVASKTFGVDTDGLKKAEIIEAIFAAGEVDDDDADADDEEF